MVNYYLYRIGQAIALSTPLRLAYAIAVAVSDINYIFARKDRLAVRDNLKAIFPQLSDKQICRIRLRMFRNFAKYLVDFFRFSKLDERFIKENIHLENMHYLDEALDKGKGAIAVTAHLGNWELGGVVISLLGYPFSAVALEHKDRKVNRFFNAQRESKGMKVIQLGRAVRQCLQLLKKNEIVALVGDRDFTARGIVIDFFGKQTFLPEGPAAFCLKAGSAIVPGFMIRNTDDTFTLRMENPMYFESSSDKNGDIRNIVIQYKPIIEEYIRRYPDQWYMFRRFWIGSEQ